MENMNKKPLPMAEILRKRTDVFPVVVEAQKQEHIQIRKPAASVLAKAP